MHEATARSMYNITNKTYFVSNSNLQNLKSWNINNCTATCSTFIITYKCVIRVFMDLQGLEKCVLFLLIALRIYPFTTTEYCLGESL
jgi:hypothetical protein